jgi:hypothetical protein
MHVFFSGVTTKVAAGSSYNVFEFGSEINLTVSGLNEGMIVTGESTATERIFKDTVTFRTVADEYHELVSLTITSGRVSEVIEAWEQNVTTYSPPVGMAPKAETWDVGTNWTESYHARSDVEGFSGSAFYRESYEFLVNATYSVLPSENITVPAGAFYCAVVQQLDSDSVTTRWVSDRVGNDVRVISESSSSQRTTVILKSYSYKLSSTSVTSMLYLALGIGVAVVAVTITVLLLRGKKGTTPGAQFQNLPPRQPPTGPAGLGRPIGKERRYPPEGNGMKCPSCWAENPEGARFCQACGHSFQSSLQDWSSIWNQLATGLSNPKVLLKMALLSVGSISACLIVIALMPASELKAELFFLIIVVTDVLGYVYITKKWNEK